MTSLLQAVLDRGPLLWLFLALLVTFLATRFITRRIRAGSTAVGNWSIGGVHVHHQVFGIVALLVAGCLEFAFRPTQPGSDVLAAIFGAGIALTLDEFALWLYLDDVYWSEQGRRSLDAVFIAIVVIGLLLVGVTPGGVTGADLQTPLAIGVALGVALVLVFIPCAIAAFKGKPVAAIVGIFVWVVAVVSAVRLAKPGSPWARWRYTPDSAKLARAERRFGAAYLSRWNWLRDLVGGTPTAHP